MDEGTTDTTAPSFDVSDEAAKQFSSLDCEVGDEVKATLKNTGPGTFEISSVEYDEEEPDKGEEAPAPDDEEKILGYKRPEGNHETPPITGLTD